MNESEFNEKYPIGTSVRYHPVIGQPEFVETATRSEAWTLDSGHVVVQVKGKSGCVSVASIEAVEQSVQSDLPKAGEKSEADEMIDRGVCPSCTWRGDVELENGVCPQCDTNWLALRESASR